MRLKKLSFVFAIIVLLTSGIFTTCATTPHYQLSRFIDPVTCGGCHDTIYQQWQNSMHNLAQKDPVYLEFARYYLKQLKDEASTDPDELAEAEICVKCHVPVGYLSGFPKTVTQELEEEDRLPDIAREGIQCDYCHSIIGARKLYNAQFKYDPGNGDTDPGIKRGPFKDSESSYHQSAYSKFHTESKICGTCHDVHHVKFGTKLETTYEEWLASPYNTGNPDSHVPCQGCHMYHRPDVPATGSTPRPKNPGTAAFGAPEREHIFTHYFVGGNSVVPASFGDDEKSAMAVSRLQNAARLELDTTDIKNNIFKIKITNNGAGHKLPTGLTDVRQMWLEIIVTNEKGKVVYASGKADPKGYLPENTIMYHTVFGDGKGNVIQNISKAREILTDNRIKPGETAVEKIMLPEGTSGKLTISARFLYRIASQKSVDMVMKEKRIKLPVIVMEAEKTSVSL